MSSTTHRMTFIPMHFMNSLALVSFLFGGCAEGPGDAADNGGLSSPSELPTARSTSEPAKDVTNPPAQTAESGKSTDAPPREKKAMLGLIDVPPYIATFTVPSHTIAVSATTTVTATTDRDIGPTPYFIQIFDATTGANLSWCGYGTSCTATISQSVPTTHAIVAYVASVVTDTLPPSGIASATAKMFVTWSNSGYQVSVTPSIACFNSGTITATASVNVGPTPYYLEIVNGDGALLGRCGSGTTCTVNAPCTGIYYAFISGFSPGLPPANTQASSDLGVMYPQPK